VFNGKVNAEVAGRRRGVARTRPWPPQGRRLAAEARRHRSVEEASLVVYITEAASDYNEGWFDGIKISPARGMFVCSLIRGVERHEHPHYIRERGDWGGGTTRTYVKAVDDRGENVCDGTRRAGSHRRLVRRLVL